MEKIYYAVGFFTVWFTGLVLLFLGGVFIYYNGWFKFKIGSTGMFWWKYSLHWNPRRYDNEGLIYDLEAGIYPKYYHVKKLRFGLYLSYPKSQ